MSLPNPAAEDCPNRELCDWDYDSEETCPGIPGVWICQACGRMDPGRNPPSCIDESTDAR